MSANFNDIAARLDPLNSVSAGVMQAHTADTGTYHARVDGEYNPTNNTVSVLLFRAGGTRPATYPVRTEYIGPIPGTGSATEVYPGQDVQVRFENGIGAGLVSKGMVEVGAFTPRDYGPPMASSWLHPETRGGRVTVYPAGDGIGHVEHFNNRSGRSTVKMGEHHVDDYGSTSTIHTGPNTSQAANQQLQAASSYGKAVSAFQG